MPAVRSRTRQTETATRDAESGTGELSDPLADALSHRSEAARMTYRPLGLRPRDLAYRLRRALDDHAAGPVYKLLPDVFELRGRSQVRKFLLWAGDDIYDKLDGMEEWANGSLQRMGMKAVRHLKDQQREAP